MCRLPARNTVSISGLPFLSSASAEKANHSTGVPLLAKQQLFARTGANGDERASFLALGYHMAVKPRLLGRRYKGYKAPKPRLYGHIDRKSTRLNSSH